MPAKRWTATEINQLLSLAGDYPTALLVTYYQQWATANNLPARTAVAIDRRLRLLGADREPIGVWIQTGTLTSLLGVSYTTVDRWVRRGYIRAHQFPCLEYRGIHPPVRYFKRSEVRAFAKRQPEFFAGVSRQNLFLLLEDERLADDIASRFPSRTGKDKVRVRCVETGRVFESCAAAAKVYRLSRNGIWLAAKKGHRAANYRWEFLRP